MAKIDPMLRMMSEKGVESTVLRSDVRYQVYMAGKSVEGPVMSGEQLRGLLEEIVPSSLSASLRDGKPFKFRHASLFGQFDFDVVDDLGVRQVTITPAPPAKAAAGSKPASAPVVPAPVAPTPASPNQTAPPPPPLQTAPLPGVIVPAPAQPTGWGQSPPAPPPSSYPPPHSPPPYQSGPNYPPPISAPVGYPQGGQPVPYGGAHLSHRSKVAAGLFAILLPGLGIHRFYLGHIGIGVLHLLLTFVLSWVTCGVTLGVAWLWSIIDGIIILTGGMRDVEGRELS